MNVVDQDTILGEMRSILEQTRAQEAVNSAEAKSNGTAAVASNAGAKSGGTYDPDEVRANWERVFSVGAEGKNANGEYFLLAMDDPDNVKYMALMIMSADLKTVEFYITGSVELSDDGFVIQDDHSDRYVPFTITNLEEGFEMSFQDGDVARMYGVSKEKILDDMLAVVNAVNG